MNLYVQKKIHEEGGQVTNHESHRKFRPIGFANRLHCDKGDRISPGSISYFLDKWKTHECSAGYKKIKEHGELTGYGLPTICSYQLAGQGKDEIVAYFAFGPFCFPLDTGTVHQFHGWAVEHGTAVPVRFQDNIQYTQNPLPGKNTKYNYVLAWGSSGGAQDASNHIKNQSVSKDQPKSKPRKRKRKTR